MEKSQQYFPEQLELLSEKVLRLGGLVEETIGNSVRALIERDSALAEEVLRGDRTIDKAELEIDDLCMELLARYQPMARDLRFVATAMKITPDLERIADHAVNISERALELNEEPPLKALVDIPLMATLAQQMVRGALDAFVREDAEAAWAVIKSDDELDRRLEQVFRVLLSHMLEEPKTISRSMRWILVAKAFERIGDQATNICEQVVYMSEARVIKHAKLRAPDEPDPDHRG
jgi:phosphate transport system protein